MSDNKQPVVLPANLPTDWQWDQIVPPNGADVGMEARYGLNYLMEQVNAAQRACNSLSQSYASLTAEQVAYLNFGMADVSNLKEAVDLLSSETAPFFELVRIEHGLGMHPQPVLGKLQYGAGMSGAGEHPAGGMETHSLPVGAVYHDGRALTIKTIKSIVDIGEPELHKKSEREYTVTFQGNNNDSLFIRLI